MHSDRRRLPPQCVEHARAFAASGRTPAEPADAATTILLRNRQLPPARDTGQVVGGLEVYLLRRHQSMAFAAGMYAFPGGRVDARDREEAPAWAGPPPAHWAQRLRCDEVTAQALVCAAVRETFEEAGVLLAGPTPQSVVADTAGAEWEAQRRALVDRSLALTELLAARGLVLRSDLLGAWAHWITPAFEPRRYDTRFFVALLPQGQLPRDVSGEADQVCWVQPTRAVAAADAGDLAMLPPTYATLVELTGFGRAEDVLVEAAERPIRPVLPAVEVDGDEAFLRLPGDLAR